MDLQFILYKENYYNVDDISNILEEIDKDIKKSKQKFDVEITQKVSEKF